ncbi:3-demethylubiquinone-9 3-O-methyltransferase [Phormidium sp. FACHB-592]|uniref:bifunctional 2-polyprenyl-6-hydroxyphenol methylase/3-demethylubiquinol 3-O-methyltransferase UbiG n=1 Tax=Cyanophyceae TaxID=3028117 RepID=UPI00168890A2|nr:bifunctional 2-polyprenyl-6-hydroxyphenol methylase/3-demethylubiquinol 3-O-methyltransferase UbiG [Phormidium sp. FACHB-592]MBD2074109.1 3-demethylubiquinone-9 3-O-methyltransferase [Phormidium sp. FACHB-592]
MIRNDLEYYDRHASTWWEEGQVLHLSNHFNKTRFEFTAAYISSWKNLNVLDVGCGGGLACETLARAGAIMSGLDQSAQSIAAAQAHANQNHLAINYRAGNAEHLPYPDNTFDCVLCFDVLEHLSNVSKVIAQIHHVLKPGGFFFFDTINRTLKSKVIMIWLLENILKQLPQGFHDWNKFIPPQELTEVLAKNGFSQAEIRGFDVTNQADFRMFQKILSKGLKEYQRDGLFPIQLNNDVSVCYIGKAIKQ